MTRCSFSLFWRARPSAENLPLISSRRGLAQKVYSSKVTVSSTRAARPQVRSWTVFFSVETLDALRASASIAISISAVGWLAGFTGYTSMVTASLFHANVENHRRRHRSKPGDVSSNGRAR
ncbi:hypothetical protein KC337_g78 [Hortaea werneckii]|nr:hypothetical protein KC337_g78 [Hortaea werneckii]